MTKPALINHNEIVDDPQTSYIIQGNVHNVTLLGTDSSYITNQSNNNTLCIRNTLLATIIDQGNGTHIDIDRSSLLTNVENFQNDPQGVIDLTTSSFVSMAAIANALEVIPGFGTVLNAQFKGPQVIRFQGDYNVALSQFHLHPTYDANGAECYRLYAAAFGREPDAGGQAFWSAQLAAGTTINSVSQGFVNSSEFHGKYGSLSISDFVSDLYQNILHRDGEQGGVQYWSTQLNSGASMAGVLVGFADSTENRMMTAGATGG